MTENETQVLLTTIEGSYKNFLMGRNKQIVFKAWYEVMRSQDYSKVHSKLTDWIMSNNTPPAISDLVCVDWRKRYEQAG